MNNSSKPSVTFIYWFAYFNSSLPSVRYRAVYPLQYLKEQNNIRYSFVIPDYSFRNMFHFATAYFSALLFRKSNSIIIIQRVHSGFIYATLLKLLVTVRKQNTIYDLDDAEYLDCNPTTINYFLQNCSAVIVGSKELKNNLSHFNKNITVNGTPTPNLNIHKRFKNETLHIGWIGNYSGAHKQSIETLFFPALRSITFKVNFTLLGIKNENEKQTIVNYFRDNTNIHLHIPLHINWEQEEELQSTITKFDVGIATLLNNEYDRSRSAFKVKQYFNNGVPVLSTNLPENNNYVIDGVNGFFCNTTDDFKNKLTELNSLSNSDYMKLSLAARSRISEFDLAAYCATLLSSVK